MIYQATVFLLESATGNAVEATLVSPLSEKHVEDWRTLWRPFQTTQNDRLREMGVPVPQHDHWSWEVKQRAIQGYLAYAGCAIEYDGVTQGMEVVNVTGTARLASQRGKPLIYVHFIEAAPWNRPSVAGVQRYRGVGSGLIGAAVTLSYEEGFQGRIGLHSLRQADSFYRDVCGMTDLGPDQPYHDLRYFEMTPAQAESFTSRGNPT